MRDEQTFWVVWCPTAGPPTKRWSSQGAAESEARRLAKANPGQEFFVLVGLRMVRHVTVEEVRLVDHLPF